jgi:hypothetical protein
VDVARFARQIALPEVGPEGQQRLGVCRAVVVGDDLAAEIAVLYLTAAGLGGVERATGAALDWTRILAGADVVVRSGFDDDGLLGAAARAGLPVIVVRGDEDRIDMVSFPKRPPQPEATLAARARAGTAPHPGAAAVLAGTLAASEAIWALLRPTGEATTAIRHLRLPLDGGEPLAQEIGAPSP